eukprot:14013895-Alexandrium_andersonii.AAC.1
MCIRDRGAHPDAELDVAVWPHGARRGHRLRGALHRGHRKGRGRGRRRIGALPHGGNRTLA